MAGRGTQILKGYSTTPWENENDTEVHLIPEIILSIHQPFAILVERQPEFEALLMITQGPAPSCSWAGLAGVMKHSGADGIGRGQFSLL